MSLPFSGLRLSPIAAAASSLVLAAGLLAGCGDDHDHADHDHDGAHDHAAHDHAAHGEAGHTHAAQHGGQLVELSEEAVHMELLLDAASGKVTAWILDGCAEKAIRIAQPEIVLNLGEGAVTYPLTLKAVESALTGEKPGDASQFEGTDPRLVGKTSFAGKTAPITVKGVTLPETSFAYTGK